MKHGVIAYYDSRDGLGTVPLDVEDGADVRAAFHAEAAHRRIQVPSYLGHESVEDARRAFTGCGLAWPAFINQRVSFLMQRGPARKASPELLQMARAVLQMARAVDNVSPEPTPLMELAKRLAGHHAKLTTDKLREQYPDLVKPEAMPVWPTSDATPPGLMKLSPMDGRLGNRWSPE